MLTIYKREMSSYFRSPIAYCIAGFFMVIVGLYFWIQNILSSSPLFSVTLSAIGMFLTFIIPFITMKLLADEKKNGTEVAISMNSSWSTNKANFQLNITPKLITVTQGDTITLNWYASANDLLSSANARTYITVKEF